MKIIIKKKNKLTSESNIVFFLNYTSYCQTCRATKKTLRQVKLEL